MDGVLRRDVSDLHLGIAFHSLLPYPEPGRELKPGEIEHEWDECHLAVLEEGDDEGDRHDDS